VYVNWLEGIRDWNISRQIWWGHRVPVWYCTQCDRAPIASRTDVEQCPDCAGAVRQDNDVLDTWFSSWLWPFSTLGWPDKTPDLRAFYPGDVLVTAPEILFFWVSRMVMSGCWFLGETPFHTVYLHGTVRDMQHRKMSKSLGNGIDPLDVVQRYGADALRWTMIAGLGLGVDVMLDPDDLEKSFAPGRNFCTKLWNMSRFLLMTVGDDAVRPIDSIASSELTAADRWILSRLDVAIADCDAALGPARPSNGRRWSEQERGRGLRLSEYAESARRFVWSELADWYLESVKPRLATAGPDREVARAVLAHVFDGALRLLHPVVPFITEELWQKLPQTPDNAFLATAPWPRSAGVHGESGAAFEHVRETVQAIRQVRADYNVNPGAFVDAVLVAPSTLGDDVTPLLVAIGAMSRSRVSLSAAAPAEASAQVLLSAGLELFVPLAGIVDLDKERKRIGDELANLDRQLSALEGRLSNEKFTAKAPPAVVEAERAKAAEWRVRRDLLAKRLESLGN
jgi:valyl-tRNA synthetase